MNKKVLWVLVVFLAFGLWAVGPASAGAPIQVKVGHVNPPGDPSYDAWEVFKKLLEEKSGGRFKVDLYPAGQLGNDERELVEQAKMGSVDMVSVNSAPLSLYYPKFDIFVLPYLWKDEPHLWRFCDGPVGKQLAAEFEKAANLKLMAYWANGIRHMFLPKKAINTPDDFKGVRVRVMNNEVYIGLFNALGAMPTPMAYGEVYTALSTGVIDAAENDTSGYLAMKFYEPAKFFSMTTHVVAIKIVLANPGFLQKIPADLRPVFDQVVTETRDWERKRYSEKQDKDLEWMRANKIQVNTIKDLSAFQAKVKPLWDKYAPKIGQELINQALATK
jgi:tripartite ATP-independent transporter DctP family solute receptor